MDKFSTGNLFRQERLRKFARENSQFAEEITPAIKRYLNRD